MDAELKSLQSADCPLHGCPGLLMTNGSKKTLQCHVCKTPISSVEDWRDKSSNSTLHQTKEARLNRLNYKRQHWLP